MFVTFLLVSTLAAQPARAQTFKVLHTFHGPDGSFPTGALVRDSAGNIYGTTSGGGTGGCGKYGCGTVFKMNKVGKELWLHSFKGTNEIDPSAGLLRDASGNLYGTTIYGGKIRKTCGGVQTGGCGTAFKVDKTGKGTVLYKFKGTPDGYFPESVLVEDATGSLYGTTYLGGANGLGAVFKIDTTGKETVLYSFSGGSSDGCSPYPGVILDPAGDVYGVATDCGAYKYGVVFVVDTASRETVLYNFSSGLDGANPDSVLLFDTRGNLYGTTAKGGTGCGGTGCGTVFELSPQPGGGWTEGVLYRFCSLSGCADGELPGSGPLVMDAAGSLYGTTYFGGIKDDGIVFKLDTGGKETVLHSFTGGSDGAFPVPGLAMDGAGNLYGTTQQGGATCFTSYTCGVVFKITP